MAIGIDSFTIATHTTFLSEAWAYQIANADVGEEGFRMANPTSNTPPEDTNVAFENTVEPFVMALLCIFDRQVTH